MPDWVAEFEHESVTSENREAFNTAMKDYPTQAEAVVGGWNAKKMIGVPFKMPESLDKLDDDASRSDFKSQAHKLLGTTPAVKSIEDLEDINFKEGLSDDAVVNDDLVGMLKKWAVDEGISKSAFGKMVKFYNGPMAEFIAKAVDAQSKQALAANETAVRECNEKMLTDFGTAEKLDEQGILMHRALLNNIGASAEEAEDLAKFMKEREGSTNPVLRRTLMKLLAPLATEGTTEGGTGTGSVAAAKGMSPYEYKKEQFPKSSDLWGSPDDKWENETVVMRKKAGITK